MIRKYVNLWTFFNLENRVADKTNFFHVCNMDLGLFQLCQNLLILVGTTKIAVDF